MREVELRGDRFDRRALRSSRINASTDRSIPADWSVVSVRFKAISHRQSSFRCGHPRSTRHGFAHSAARTACIFLRLLPSARPICSRGREGRELREWKPCHPPTISLTELADWVGCW